MKKAALFACLIVQILIIIGFWGSYHVNHMMGNQLTGDWIGQSLAWGRLAGLLAAFGILMLMLLISRATWLEGVFGMDRLARAHHIVGFSLILLLVLHPILLTLGHSAQAGIGTLAQTRDFVKNWDDVFGAMLGLDLILIAIVLSIGVVLKKIRYEIWYYNHLFLYVAIALAFGHQIAVGSDFTENRIFKIYWFVLYAFVAGVLVYSRFLTPLNYYVRHRFTVARLVAETGDVTSVYIEGKNLDQFPARAGQFMIVRFLAKGFWFEAHPFSISCLPDGKHLRLTIKQLGDFTRKIPGLKPGTPVLIDGPHGIFTAAQSHSTKVLMIAGGIGITPIRSVAEELVFAGRDVILIYGNRDAHSLAFKAELDALTAKSGGRLKVIPVMNDDPAWPGEKGRVDRQRIARLVPDLAERDVFLCGPPVMMKSARKSLSELNVPSSRIHDERFAL